MKNKHTRIDCPICKKTAPWIFRHKVLRRYSADLHLCPDCDYLFVAEPAWLAEAYTKVINAFDTGFFSRMLSLREETALPLFLMSSGRKPWVDYGAGHGGYVRIMRDLGFDFFWHDPMAENLFAIGFNEVQGQKFYGATCFECFEHFLNPIDEVKKILTRATRIIFSTELRPQAVPDPKKWLYYGWEHGQHVGFHSRKSLQILGRTLGLSLVSSGAWLHAFLPENETQSLSARLIRDGKLPLAAWRQQDMRILLDFNCFLRSLWRGRVVSKDFLGVISRVLGSRTWPDHMRLKKIKDSSLL